jgi:sulfate adenylyltransferase large subunit
VAAPRPDAPPEPLDGSLLRLSTVGSIDDGKSTLIGRLLYDSKGILEDQLAAVEQATRWRGAEGVNLALLTDGLRAERDQGITIDVAYRYFATARRTFILADTPGHFQYTRNMVTGASTADVAVVLLDVTRGVVQQSRRHASIAALLRVPHLAVCVNKMDLVGYGRAAFERVRRDFQAYAERLDVGPVRYFPISALHGDNVVARSTSMAWYDGPSLLEFLETVPNAAAEAFPAVRFPIQLVLAPDERRNGHGERPWIAGRLESGVVRIGDRLRSMATGRHVRVAAIRAATSVDVAFAGTSVAFALEPAADLQRGDLLVAADRAEPLPAATNRFWADVCWVSERPLRPGSRLAIKHTTRTVGAVCEAIRHRIDVDSQAGELAPDLALNEIGLVEFATDAPVFVDRYRDSRGTGSFIVIDPETNETAAAGMVASAE